MKTDTQMRLSEIHKPTMFICRTLDDFLEIEDLLQKEGFYYYTRSTLSRRYHEEIDEMKLFTFRVLNIDPTSKEPKRMYGGSNKKGCGNIENSPQWYIHEKIEAAEFLKQY